MKRAIPYMPLALLLATLVYLPGLTGGFAFDDYPNILLNDNINDAFADIESLAQTAWSGGAGPLKRPISMLSFALNKTVTGDWPMAYKVTNLTIHLLNGFLVFLLARLIFRALARHDQRITETAGYGLAVAVSAVWLLHPLNLTAVLYVVQRMTSLSALFSFLAIIAFCAGRLRIIGGERFGLALVFLAAPLAIGLGALSKENALLTAPVLVLIECCLFRFAAADRRIGQLVKAATLVMMVTPIILIVAFYLTHPTWITDAYQDRPFSVEQRVLTEGRVIWFYISLLVLPRLNQFALYHDDIAVSASMLDPTSTAFALAALVTIIIAALVFWRRTPVLCLAVFWFLIGHAMESTIMPLELTHEHRNYFPSVGLIMGLAYLVYTVSLKAQSKRLPMVAATGIVMLLAGLTHLRAENWSDPITLAVTEAQNHPNSYRSVYAAARSYFALYLIRGDEEIYAETIRLLEASVSINKTTTRPYYGLFQLAHLGGTPPSPHWREALIDRLKTAKFHYTEWHDLNRLVKCYADKERCSIPRESVLEFYLAALENDNITTVTRGHLMLDLAVFYVNEMQDYEPAVALLDAVVALRPDEFQVRMTRAEIMLLGGYLDRVEQALVELEQQRNWTDKLFTPLDQVALLRNALDEQRSAGTP